MVFDVLVTKQTSRPKVAELCWSGSEDRFCTPRFILEIESVAKYHVCVDGDQDIIDDAREVEADDMQDAAQEYVRLQFANLDYPDEIEVWVQRKAVDAKPVKWNVVTVREVQFRARELTAK